MRFIATADLQIGMQLHWLGEAQERFAAARIATITTIVRPLRLSPAGPESGASRPTLRAGRRRTLRRGAGARSS